MKRIVAIVLAVLVLLGLVLPVVASATETTDPSETTEATETTAETTEAATEPARAPDECGDGLTWTYKSGTLTVSGSGAMDDYAEGGEPWAQYRDSITTVIFTGGITYVGSNAFRDYNALKAIDFGSSMHTIGEKAFQSCEGLTEIHLPATFRRFGPQSFEGCTGLTKVWCAGSMPSFNQNCLWNYTFVTVYCPTNNVWPASAVEELETNFGGRLQVLAADGEDPFDFGEEETEEPTEATTEPAAEPTVEPTTAPTTEPETEPTTQATTEPATEATEMTEEPAEEETLPTEEVEETEPEEKGFLAGKSWIGIVIIAGLLTLLIIGALIVRSSGRGGKYMR